MASLFVSFATLVVIIAGTCVDAADRSVAWSSGEWSLLRQAAGSRELLATSDATKTIFNNGWAPKCGWWALGAFNISIVPGAGVGQSNGLCTTFPAAGGWMSFRCSGSDNLASALKQTSAVEYFVSQLPDGQIDGSKANATIPAGLQLTLQDSDANFLCKQSLGLNAGPDNGININNGLVQTSNKFQVLPDDQSVSDQDCNLALQNASAIGFRSLWDGVTFCIDAMQLV